MDSEPIGKPVYAAHLDRGIALDQPQANQVGVTGVVFDQQNVSMTVLHRSSSRGRRARPNQNSSIDCHSGDEILQIAGFAYIAVRSQFVTAHNVLRRLGRAEDRNRNLSQQRVGFDLRQHRAAVLPGEIQVQNHQVRKQRIGVLAFPAQKRDCLHAVGDSVDM